MPDTRSTSPFEPHWLDELSTTCAADLNRTPQLDDLYLEQRLELRAIHVDGSVRFETCRSEGSAARWAWPNRNVLHARTGVSPRVLGGLLNRYRSSRVECPHPVSPPERLAAPGGWREWARELVHRMRPMPVTARYFKRRAVVVRPDTWTPVHSPGLIRVEVGGSEPTALLAVEGHPELGRWLTELASPPPHRSWRPESGCRLPVVFAEGTAGVLMHEIVGHMVEGDLATANGSPLVGLDGATITTQSLNLDDDPTRFDLPGAFSSDDEGFEATPMPLVSAGRLTGWLCDRSRGRRLGRPPGRARRERWNSPPLPRISNLVISPGTVAAEDFERDVKRGLVVTRLARATVDPVSAQLLLQIERGWELANGRRRRPLDGGELTGSVLEVLADIDESIGGDQQTDWRLGWCIKGGAPMPTGSVAPTLLVHRLTIL